MMAQQARVARGKPTPRRRRQRRPAINSVIGRLLQSPLSGAVDGSLLPITVRVA
jgi:hypothetical protein